ncbi:hypothetical protein [Rufibacter soli]
MKNILYKFISIGVGLLFPGWVHAQKGFFIPEPLVIPVHSQPQQLHLSLGVGGGVGLVTSYAITNNMAVYASGSRNPWSSSHSSLLGGRYKIDKKNYALAGGVGYLANPGAEGWVMELFAGAAFQHINNLKYSISLSYDDPGTKTDAEYWSYNGQVNLIKRKPKSEFGGALRISYNRYSTFHFIKYSDSPNIRRMYKGLWSANLEPVASYSYKLGQFKINGQAGFSVPVLREWNEVYMQDINTKEEGVWAGVREKVGIAAFIFRVGLQYNLNFAPAQE